MAHFLAPGFAFTIWTLTPRLPMGILSCDSRKAGEDAGRKVVRFGANHVGRSRGDASDPAVVHITGAQRPDPPWRQRGRDPAGRCRRIPVRARDLHIPRAE